MDDDDALGGGRGLEMLPSPGRRAVGVGLQFAEEFAEEFAERRRRRDGRAARCVRVGGRVAVRPAGLRAALRCPTLFIHNSIILK